MLLGRPFQAKMVTLGLLLLMCLSQPSQVLGLKCYNGTEDVPDSTEDCIHKEEACVANNVATSSDTAIPVFFGCMKFPIKTAECVIKELGQTELNAGKTPICCKHSDPTKLGAARATCKPDNPPPPGPPGEPAKRSARKVDPEAGPPYWLCYCTTDECNKGVTAPTWTPPEPPKTTTSTTAGTSNGPTPSGGPGGGPAGNGAEGIKNTAVGLVASIVLAAGLLSYHRG